ncbi:TPA: hypothetical protein RVS92_001338 [Pasteurella multocida]|uniref:hypothetical protein n=1 Tax=Pasteurella multocida TaxID=747 RepID=UPI000743E4F1|nr:hypothetical protein [Pasteurella multocida]KUM15325.1 hypothetical protein ASV60_10220 [Pasteurella multocida]MCL7759467.1 hypothetical protein [Pasteurella multocida]MCL7821712.1 hypothetical protein [Pasteurella multocida]MEB3485424.1 hypothetical protein [Pasteurella multocida]MEB3494360.1 hypothetical protein [Pasteurella multocida]
MDRESYKNIKAYYLESGYDWCKRKFYHGEVHREVEPSLEWSGANYDWENAYDSTIEKLMLFTVEIICNAGRFKDVHIFLLDNIQKILSEHDLNHLLKDLGKEEREDFLYDLNLVLNNREIK